jgi:PII-like signaling protein
MEPAAADDEVMIVRVYLREGDHGRRKTLMQELLNILHDQQPVQHVVVCRGIAGFDDGGEVYAADLLRLQVDLPLVLEFFDKPAVAEAAIAMMDEIVPAGHILHWRATRHGGACSS